MIDLTSSRGVKSPVLVADQIDWLRDYSATKVGHLLGMSNRQLAAVDPLVMNLLVAKDLPSLASLDISRYQETVNQWTEDFLSRCLPHWEPHFYDAPQDFDNHLGLFRLGMVCQYLDLEIGITYIPEQRNVKKILYTNPSHLFLNGLIDTRTGTCGNMPALHVAIAWRLGWPVSLTSIGTHFLCRYDDGKSIFNIETTDTGRGGWSTPDDATLIARENISSRAIACGSELRALTHREMLACFIALRARHLQDLGQFHQQEHLRLAAEQEWLLARSIFPSQRLFYQNQMACSALRGDLCFDPNEPGHPLTFVQFLSQLYGRHPIGPADFHLSGDLTSPSLTSIDAHFRSSKG